MPNYIVNVERHYSYAVSVEAEDEEEAIEAIRNYEIEDLEPFETDAYFEFSA